MTEDIKELLSEWARWRYVDSGSNIGYPSRASFAWKIPPSPGEWGARTPVIDDQTAERVDKAVSQLYRVCMESAASGKVDRRFDVLTESYLFRRSDSRIARLIKVDRRSVLNIRQNAENYISGVLDTQLWNS